MKEAAVEFWNCTFADLAPSVDYSQDLINSVIKLNKVKGETYVCDVTVLRAASPLHRMWRMVLSVAERRKMVEEEGRREKIREEKIRE